MTGIHETAHFQDFSFGVANRAASFRIPTTTAANNGKGYIEDRRPNANADPYVLSALLTNTICNALA